MFQILRISFQKPIRVTTWLSGMFQEFMYTYGGKNLKNNTEFSLHKFAFIAFNNNNRNGNLLYHGLQGQIQMLSLKCKTNIQNILQSVASYVKIK